MSGGRSELDAMLDALQRSLVRIFGSEQGERYDADEEADERSSPRGLDDAPVAGNQESGPADTSDGLRH